MTKTRSDRNTDSPILWVTKSSVARVFLDELDAEEKAVMLRATARVLAKLNAVCETIALTDGADALQRRSMITQTQQARVLMIQTEFGEPIT